MVLNGLNYTYYAPSTTLIEMIVQRTLGETRRMLTCSDNSILFNQYTDLTCHTMMSDS